MSAKSILAAACLSVCAMVAHANEALDDARVAEIISAAMQTIEYDGPYTPVQHLQPPNGEKIDATDATMPMAPRVLQAVRGQVIRAAEYAAPFIVKFVIGAETLNLALDLWNRVKLGIDSFLSRISTPENEEFVADVVLCPVNSVTVTPEGMRFELHCPTPPRAPQS